MKVSVSILKEINELQKALKKVNESNSDYIHLDIMDNTFTDSSSFTIDDIKDLDINKKIDVHLMSTNLDKLIDDFSILNPEYITFHIEVGSTLEYIYKIKDKGIKVGLAINPETDIEKIYPYLELVDLFLVMSVYPGEGGQKFITDVISKMQELKEIQERYNYRISVDGGINNNTIKYVKDYADIVVSGSYITNNNNYDDMINTLKIYN